MPNKLGLSVALTADPEKFKQGLSEAVKATQSAGKNISAESKKISDNLGKNLSPNTGKFEKGIQGASSALQGFGNSSMLAGTAAGDLFNIISSSPFGILGTVLTGVIALAVKFNEVYMQSADVSKQVSKASLEAAQSAKQEQLELDALYAAATDVNLSLKTRKNAIKELNDKYPEFNKNLSIETANSNEAAEAHKRASEALLIKAKTAAVSGLITELYKKETQAAYDYAQGNLDLLSTTLALSGGTGQIGYINLENKKAQTWKKQREALEALYISLTKVDLEFEKQGKSPKVKVDHTYEKELAKLKKQIAAQKELDAAMKDSALRNTQQGLKQPVNANIGGLFKVGQANEIAPRALSTASEYAASLAEEASKVTLNVNEMNDALNNASAEGLTSMASAIGIAIATGQDLGQAIGQSFLTSMSDFLIQMGKMMITTASVWDAFQKSLATQPEVAIILGVAAVAAGAALKASIAKGAQPSKFAMGGIIPGNNFYGDRVPIMANSGEMILNKAQQGSLHAMIRNNTFSSGGGVHIVPIIDNRGLAVQVKLGQKQLQRG